MRRAPLVLAVACLGAFASSAQNLGGEGLMHGALSVQSISSGFGRAASGGVVAVPPIFDATYDTNGPSLLSDSLTMNGTPMTLVLSCDASGFAGAGGDLVCATGGTFANTNAGSDVTSAFGDFVDSAGDDALVFSGTGDAFTRAGNIAADVDTVIEIVFLTSSVNARAMIATSTSTAAAAAGMSIATSAGTAALRLSDGTDQIAPIGPTAVVPSGALAHAFAFVDDDTNAGMCTNGACGAAVSMATIDSWAGSVGTTDLGRFVNGAASTIAGEVYAWRVWTCAGCVTSAGAATVALERAARLWGVEADTAVTATPSVMTRSSASFTDYYEEGVGRTLGIIAGNAPRLAIRRSAGGTVTTGILSEPQTSNLALQSQTLDNATWSKVNCAASADAAVFPTGAITADALESTDAAGSVEHYIRQSINHTATTYTASAWVDQGREARYVWIRNATIANGVAWFDTTTCAAGTVQAGISATHSEDDWDGTECRVGITYTGTAAAHNIDIGYSNGDGVLAYDDGTDSTVDAVISGVEVEAFATMTSYQVTTTASVTRTPDVLSYASAGNTSTTGTLAFTTLCPSFNTASTSKGGIRIDANNFVELTIDATDDRPGTNGTVGGAAQWTVVGSSGDVTDGEVHETRITYDTNDVDLYYDGVLVGTDTTASMLASVAGGALQVGHINSASQSACLITRVRAWDSVVTP
jgi:hypothetical protein